jgi:hypothetical protein
MEDIKQVASLVQVNDDTNDEDTAAMKLKGEELQIFNELKDIYNSIKEKLELSNLTLERIIYEDLKFSPNQLMTSAGL